MWMIEKMQKAMQQMRTDTNPPVAKPKPIASVNQQVGAGYMWAKILQITSWLISQAQGGKWVWNRNRSLVYWNWKRNHLMLESVSNYLGNIGIGISCYWNRDWIQGFGKTLESESLSALPELESKSRVPELLTTLVRVCLIYEIWIFLQLKHWFAL